MDSEALDFIDTSFKGTRIISFLGRQETILYTKDGREVPISLSASRLEKNGIQKSIVCLFQDISKQKQTQTMLRRQALIFQSIADGIIVH